MHLFVEQEQYFSPVNYATTMSQLGRIRAACWEDPKFLRFREALNLKLTQHGLKWLGSPRSVANILHGIAKTGRASDTTALHIVRLIDYEDNATWICENGSAQNVANCAWACGRLEIPCPKLFELIDQKVEWLSENGNTQNIANCVWAVLYTHLTLPTNLLFEFSVILV